jgi:hypothetical protein
MTLKTGVERVQKEEVPELKEVVAFEKQLTSICDTMKNIFKMDMVSGPLRLKSSALGGRIQMAQDYGREIGEKLVE